MEIQKRVKANSVVLTEQQVQFYDENGYVIIPAIFDEESCEIMAQAAETVAEEDYSVALNVHRKVDLFLEIMKNPVLVAMVEAVQRHRVVGLNSQFLYKKPGTPYARQTWNPHQDNAYVKAKYGAYMQLHVFVDQNDKENGGLFYYPGSQKEDLLPYEYVKSWKEEVEEDGFTRPGWKVVPPVQYKKVDAWGPKGGVCLQHGNVIHGSYPNLTSHRWRRQYSMAFLNEGEEFLKGQTSIKIPVILR